MGLNKYVFFLFAIHPTGFSKFLTLNFILTTPSPLTFPAFFFFFPSFPASDAVFVRSISYNAPFILNCHIERKNYFNSFMPRAGYWPHSVLLYFFCVILASVHGGFVLPSGSGWHALSVTPVDVAFEETTHCG